MSTASGRFSVRAHRADLASESSLDLHRRTSLAGLSADGRTVLRFEARETGQGAYLRSTDGRTTIRLGNETPVGLSPDGAWALLFTPAPSPLKLVPTGSGQEREIATAGLAFTPDPGRARWSRDGRRLCPPYS